MLETINKTIKTDTDKINKTTSSIYLYEVENRILEANIFYLIDNNIITYEETNNEIIYNIIPEYDGIKTYNNEAINEEIIHKLNEYIFSIFNIGIFFTINIIDEFIPSETVEETKKYKVDDDFRYSFIDVYSPYEIPNCFLKYLDDGKYTVINIPDKAKTEMIIFLMKIIF